MYIENTKYIKSIKSRLQFTEREFETGKALSTATAGMAKMKLRAQFGDRWLS